MKNYFKISIITVAIFSLSLSANYINNDQLRQYVQNCTTHLFGNARENNQDMQELQQTINQNVRYHYNECRFNPCYDTARVYEAILNQSVNFIMEKAQKHTRNTKKLIELQQELIEKISSRTTLEQGILTPYIGKQLQQRLASQLTPFYQNNNQPRPQEPKKLYPTESCCVCLEDFDERNIEQIFLAPCGHDICKGCATQWFFGTQTRNSTCPHCRSAVNLDQVRNIVFEPSAPPAY